MNNPAKHICFWKGVRHARLVVILIIATMLCGNRAFGVSPFVTDTISMDIYYPLAGHEADSTFNADIVMPESLLVKIVSRPTAVIRDVSIVSGTCPNGSSRFNQRLSEKRSESARRLLASLPGAENARWSVTAVGINWHGLADKVKTANITDADSIIKIIENTSTRNVNRQSELRRLDGGRAWKKMEREIFPYLRASHVRIIYTYYNSNIDSLKNIPITTNSLPLSTECRDLVHKSNVHRPLLPKKEAHTRRDYLLAVRTNLAADILAVPSLGAELSLPHGLSVAIDGYYAWWSKRSKVRYWRAQGVELSLRKYFGHSSLTGHHVGVYSQLMRYDFCLGKRGILSGGSGAAFTDHPTWGVGIEYGYSLKLGKRLRLDTSLGIGWLTGRYLKYEAMDGHSVYRSAHNRKWIGPTRLGLSLVWIIGKGGRL